MNQSLPKVISSQSDACRFCWWLDEHQEIENIQGWKVERNNEGKFVELRSDIRTRISLDIHELMENRKMLNDWIRSRR